MGERKLIIKLQVKKFQSYFRKKWGDVNRINDVSGKKKPQRKSSSKRREVAQIVLRSSNNVKKFVRICLVNKYILRYDSQYTIYGISHELNNLVMVQKSLLQNEDQQENLG